VEIAFCCISRKCDRFAQRAGNCLGDVNERRRNFVYEKYLARKWVDINLGDDGDYFDEVYGFLIGIQGESGAFDS
jgi:hypothetical protein